MLNFQIRDGIVLKNICDEWLLIAVGEAADHCMYVRQINDTLAYFWQQIEQGKSFDEIIMSATEEYDTSAEQIEKDLKILIKQLCEMNYLITEQADNDEV